MKPVAPPRLDLSPEQAEAQQRLMAARVVAQDAFGDVRTVAGVDVAYEKDGDRVFAAVIVLDAVSLEVRDAQTHVARVAFPYVPGLFSFRELPPVLECFERLALAPDLIVCDAQGRAHPRRFGLACHLGVLLDAPTIGCAKTRLVGTHDEPGAARGDSAALMEGPEQIGLVLRTRDAVKPVFVSVGHRVSLSSAAAWVLRLAPRYRLPETTRAADQAVNRLRAARS